MGGNNNDSNKECGITQHLTFMAAIISGTACSICSKLMMELQSVGISGNIETFTKPLFQTFGMFIGMTFGLIMHFIVLYFHLPFPGYHEFSSSSKSNSGSGLGSLSTTSSQSTESSSDVVSSSSFRREISIEGNDVKKEEELESGTMTRKNYYYQRQQQQGYNNDVNNNYNNNNDDNNDYNNNNDNGININYSSNSNSSSSSNNNNNNKGDKNNKTINTTTSAATNIAAKETDALLGNNGTVGGGGGGKGGEMIETTATTTTTPTWMYFFLAIPSLFDLGATALCMIGLQYLNVSIYQMLRGSGIIFVALMKQHVLRHTLHKYQWVGVFWNVISVLLVGTTAMLASSSSSTDSVTSINENRSGDGNGGGGGEALLGVLFVLAGAFVQALQFVFEEKVMTMDIPAPPLLLIGMEGLWGTILCLFILYPLAYYAPGYDYGGSYENLKNTMVMFKNSSTIQYAFIIYFATIFLYNLFAVLVTYMLSSVWHAILDNFRPITVWIVDMIIFYCISKGTLGESWTKWSFIQLVGMLVLLYGTAIYNAPNAGSLKLQGQWWAFYIDLSREYINLEEEEEDVGEEEEEDEVMKDAAAQKEEAAKEGGGSIMWEGKRIKGKEDRTDSLLKYTPGDSVHTQALRPGFGSPKI